MHGQSVVHWSGRIVVQDKFAVVHGCGVELRCCGVLYRCGVPVQFSSACTACCCSGVSNLRDLLFGSAKPLICRRGRLHTLRR